MKNNSKIIAPLTVDNAHLVSTIININNPEWGSHRFFHNGQDLNDGQYCDTFGKSGEAILFKDEYKFWGVGSFNQ